VSQEEKTKIYPVRMPTMLYRKLQRLADEDHRTLGNFILHQLKEFVKGKDK
jgi:hypothetical protein